MEEQHEYQTLLDRGVVSEHGNSVRLTSEFDTAWIEIEEEFNDEHVDLTTAIDRRVSDMSAEQLVELCDENVTRLAGYVALADRLPEHSPDAILRFLPVVEEIQRGPPAATGVPDSFMPAYPDQLPLFLALTRRAIVYVWREDCPPCDLLVEDFNSLFTDPPDDILLLAVYGPEDPAFLQERYDVTGGPTTLFVVDGEVDLRLHGAQYPEVLESEVERFRKLHSISE